ANGSFQTALGNFVSDINLKLNKKKTASSYRGYLKTDNFQIGKLIGNTDVLNAISIDGRIQGSGFDAKTAQLKLDAKIAAITVKGYNYRNITTDGEFRREAFTGKFQVNDPNLKMQGNGTINLEKGKQRFDLVTVIEQANLKALNLTDADISLKTNANLDFTGLKVDELLGFAAFRNSVLTYEGKTVALDSVKVISVLTPLGRQVIMQSELLDVNAEGNFSITGLVADINTLITEYELNFENDPAAIDNYYRRKIARTVPQDYQMAFGLDLKHVSPLLQLFVPALVVSDHSKIEGSFRNGETAIFTFSGQIDTLLYDKYELYANNFEVTTSKLPYSNEVLAQAFLTSKNQQIPSAGATENFFVEGIWNERKIRFATNIAQTGTTNRASLSGDLNFLPDRLQFVFSSSRINILDKAWSISPENTVEIQGREIAFNNLVLAHQDQSISIKGFISENPAQSLLVNVTNFRLQNLNSLMEQKMSGILNADLQARDLYKQLILQSNLKVDSLYFDQILIGDVAGNSTWDNSRSRLMVDLGVARDEKKVLNVNGAYNPKGGDQQLNMLAVMDGAQVKIVEPFLKVIMTDMEGTMDGNIRILGRLDGPILKGVANVRNGRFNFTYLNTVYSFSDRVYFAENGITFRNINLRDILGNTATLNGGVYHDGFKNMVIDLKASFRRFMVLNTTRQLNELYYGTAIATGDVSVFGPTENLTVRVDARSEKGTRISIPLNTQAEASRQEFINFVNHNVTDTTKVRVAVQDQKTDLSGIKLNFNLDVTDDAYVEIIFDERTGDIVRGTGNGRIRMTIDTRGEFSMYGMYEVTQGAYNFTLYNLINKEFQVRPGGTITWNGEPYGGILNLKAVYSQRVTMTEVLQLSPNALEEDPALRRPYPVNVLMGLSGNLLNPEIKLDLEFEDISPIETALQPFISSIRNDEQELNRQVFSLMAFRRFSPVGEFSLGSNAGTDALNSLSEWASNAL
ncbi:MAG TPA: translocation/assembly module TamB domain-containing protein, partial [Adhaeribacter sp.]|nr:translocation/assembly module TamB domain-containing protein [Adhaeribacter sp.]